MTSPSIESYVFRHSLPAEFMTESVVLVDTHNFTTTAIEALANGAKEVIPLTSLSEGIPNRVTILAGDGDCNRDNHPNDMTVEDVQGEVVGIESWNGAPTVHTLRSNGVFDDLYLGSMTNSSTLAQELTGASEVTFVLAGSNGTVPPEDALTVACIQQHMLASDEQEIEQINGLYDSLYEFLVSGVYDEMYSDTTELGPYGRPENHAQKVASDIDRHSIIPTLHDRGGFTVP